MRLAPVTLLIVACASIGLSACGKPANEGAAQKTTGKVESAVGSVTGDQSLKNEGQKDQVVGGVKDAAHDLKDAVGAAAK